MPFTIGALYTRAEISRQFGGNPQAYLPFRDGRVTCGCFNTDRNPRAPREILVGDGTDIMKAADMLVRQGGSTPVFMKRGSQKWEYLGPYRVERSSKDMNEIRPKAAEARRSDVTMLLQLAPVED
ncbi:MAG: hypothetical protein M3Q65_12485 [Chloroflexota bacterium]|nr:hypothetical protein [Chloroflexota bacterium]